MALLERIGTLVRANLNELADRAEEPVTMMKQLILDMENQLLQVKTQVAIAIADQHLLERKRADNLGKGAEFLRKAELALEKGQEPLARAALERRLSHDQLEMGFEQQVADQQAQVESLKSALRKLEAKLAEAQGKCDLLIAQHRRARAVGKAVDAADALDGAQAGSRFRRLEDKVHHAGAVSQARAELLQPGSEEQLDRLEKDDKIDRMLAELKDRKRLTS